MTMQKSQFKSLADLRSFIESSINDKTIYPLVANTTILDSRRIREAMRKYLPISPGAFIEPEHFNYIDYRGVNGDRISFTRNFLEMFYRVWGPVELPVLTKEFVKNFSALLRTDSTTVESTAYLQFSRDVEWTPGEFGDKGSCYWGGKSGARQMILDNNGFALKFYSDQEGNNKLGRCWGVVYKEEGLLLWNGYAKKAVLPQDFTLHYSFGRLIADTFNLRIKKINLSNNGSVGGTLYINNGGSLLKVDNSNYISKIDLKWKEKRMTQCRYCGYQSTDTDNFEFAANNNRVACKKCAPNVFDMCNYDMNIYSNEALIVGPDNKKYYVNNIHMVEAFVPLVYGGYEFRNKAKLLRSRFGEESWIKETDNLMLCSMCGKLIESNKDNMCSDCLELANVTDRIRQDLKNIYVIRFV